MKKSLTFLMLFICLCFSLVSCDNGSKTYTVSFNSNGGSEVASQNLAEGALVTKPNNPSKDGYSFVDWYSDEALENVWNFASDKVNSNLTLYAKWEEIYNGYSVKVVDDNLNPIQGIVVQWCDDSACHGGNAMTGDDGVLKNPDLKDGTYNVHLLAGVPSGYVYNPNVETNVDNKQITITLIKAASASGEGSIASPYNVSLGAYSASFSDIAGRNYYIFTPSEAGTYVIESHVMAKQNEKPLDLVLVTCLNDEFKQDQIYNDGGKGDNFKVEIEVASADVNKAIYFFIQPSRSTEGQLFPNEFYFDIVKK